MNWNDLRKVQTTKLRMRPVDNSVMEGYQEPVPQTGYVNTEPAFEGAGLPTVGIGDLEFGISDLAGTGLLSKAGLVTAALMGGIKSVGKKAIKEAPQVEAMRLAQQRAALLVEQHGLGLPPDNTPQMKWGNTPRESFYEEIVGSPIYNAAYKGQRAGIVEMTPDEYLRHANPYAGSLEMEQRKLESIRKGVIEGKEFGLPYLRFDETGKVVGQEGRHRATVAKETGHEKIPVAVANRSKVRDYELEQLWKSGKISSEDARKRLGLDQPLEYPNPFSETLRGGRRI